MLATAHSWPLLLIVDIHWELTVDLWSYYQELASVVVAARRLCHQFCFHVRLWLPSCSGMEHAVNVIMIGQEKM